MGLMMVNKRANIMLVCDLDNTLYDWVGYFTTAFYAMVDEVVRITNCDRNKLLADFRQVHRKYHDSEHPFSLLETDTIRNLFPNYSKKDLVQKLDSAFYAFNKTRKDVLKTYPSVHETLSTLQSQGVTIVAHTESKLFAVVDRLMRLELSQYFKRIYCRERADIPHPNGQSNESWLSKFPMEKIVELSLHQRKPDPTVLREICRAEGFLPSDTYYVGDSIARDVLMAKEAKVFAIWAKYGVSSDNDDYEKLVQVSHWTSADVDREKMLRLKAQNIQPDFILENDFAEIRRALKPINHFPRIKTG